MIIILLIYCLSCTVNLYATHIGFVGFVRHDFMLIAQGNKRVLDAWLRHGIGLIFVAVWVVFVAGINPLTYLVCAAYPAASLLMVRTFAEHRAAEAVAQRTAIVESRSLFSFLFLNNNLHAVHHHRPRLPWYMLPAYYRRHRAKFIEKDGVDVVPGYGSIFRRYLLKAREPIIHPFLRRGGFVAKQPISDMPTDGDGCGSRGGGRVAHMEHVRGLDE